MQCAAPSIEAPRLQDEVILLKGPDKGRCGSVLWISKGENGKAAKVNEALSSLGRGRLTSRYLILIHPVIIL